MDTEELHQKLLKTRYNDLKVNGWIGKSFTYQFNSQGFRCSEFSHAPTLMTLGCSFTVGVGVPLEDTWPSLVSKNLNMQCANLGQGGGSADTAFRLCHGYIDVIKPTIVVFMQPPNPRFEMLIGGMVHMLSSYSPGPDKKNFERWARDEDNAFFNREKNTLAIQALCLQRGIKFISVDHSDLFNLSFSKARDLAHPGVENHKLFSELLISKI
jgi:hypothetical protein